MTGVFTDNQPDFTWLAPHATKTFTQWFLPYKGIGEVKCANADILVGLSVANGEAVVRVYASKRVEDTRVRLVRHQAGNGLAEEAQVLLDKVVTVSPAGMVELCRQTDAQEWELTLSVTSQCTAPVVYTPAKPEALQLPEPARAIGAPETLPNTEALLLAGLHLEQYRHATREPDPYYLEGLKRDPEDLRLNNAYGNLLLRRGQYQEAQTLFEIGRASCRERV